MKEMLLCTLIVAGSLMACAYPSSYALFAETVRSNKEMEHAISLRIPMVSAPNGTKIFCNAGNQLTYAEKLDRSRIKVRYSDGKEVELDLPSGDEFPVGMVTYWLPGGKAQVCGMYGTSPIGANAYVLWGEFTLYFKRADRNKMLYTIRDEQFALSYPLTPADRQTLREKSVPLEIANLLY